jgi:hypothetical protein
MKNHLKDIILFVQNLEIKYKGIPKNEDGYF